MRRQCAWCKKDMGEVPREPEIGTELSPTVYVTSVLSISLPREECRCRNLSMDFLSLCW